MSKSSGGQFYGTSRWTTLVALAVIAALSGCGRSTTDSPQDASTSVAANASPDRNAPAERDHNHPVVDVDTSEGKISIRLDAQKSPGTVRSFLNYVNEGFYDNTLFHYVAPGSMVVAGGYGLDRKSKATRPPIRNEAHNGWKNTRGTVAMARDATLIDSATSQFFINLADAPQRDHKGDTAADYGYCVFGEVTDGLNIADKIAQSATADLGNDLAQTPDPAVVIKSIRIRE